MKCTTTALIIAILITFIACFPSGEKKEREKTLETSLTFKEWATKNPPPKDDSNKGGEKRQGDTSGQSSHSGSNTGHNDHKRQKSG